MVPIFEARKTWRISTGADDLFLLLGRQHARQRCLHLIDGVVDDVVVADIDAEALGRLAGTGIGTGVEADDDGFGGLRQVDVGFGNAADRAVDDVDLDFAGRSFCSDCTSASCEPWTSALMISGRVLASPSAIWSKMFSSLAACCLASLTSRNLP